MKASKASQASETLIPASVPVVEVGFVKGQR